MIVFDGWQNFTKTTMSESVADCITTDPELTPVEQETSITYSKCDSKMRIYSAEKPMVRGLWHHTYADVEALTIAEDKARRNVKPGEHDGESVVGIRATAPIGLLKMGKEPRSTDSASYVVSDQKDVDFDTEDEN